MKRFLRKHWDILAVTAVAALAGRVATAVVDWGIFLAAVVSYTIGMLSGGMHRDQVWTERVGGPDEVVRLICAEHDKDGA